MPSFSKIATLVAGFAAAVSAAPAAPQLTARQTKMYEMAKRQNAGAAALGISDVDIAQFALTLEWLENEFYRQGFLKFGDDAFRALGLNDQQLSDLKSIGKSEETHVVTLTSAIAAAGVQPVQPCTYNFGFTDAAGMVATAAVLESVGVSAYLGAATLIFDPKILALAGSILTVEARHQSFIRAASGIVASPSPFDTPLGPKAVFSLAAPFIQSCPEGSNLILTAFPTLALASPQAAEVKTLVAGSMLNFQSDAAAGATFCGFTNSGAAGGTSFTPFTAGTGCALPPNLSGLVYVSLTNAAPKTGVITDAITMAGPTVLQLS
ncbi:ferritin-like domain-containing protein [Microdochium trichocladiopsis]|uniref:Ferritin-like domain-containing protein n=1 Tax=Microdochium trichocladiopsis TaxID=1682393 RepID=A0A9P9BRM2_9PEZI|nr:ferritin-like domain-containing protein [Microdochium trichocladiopsis]KAH7032965.1 ferritin-like domain-containing protein [Microdochium trichocladiopsis]